GADRGNGHQQRADASENRAQCHSRSLFDAIGDLRDGHIVISLPAYPGVPSRLCCALRRETRASCGCRGLLAFILAQRTSHVSLPPYRHGTAAGQHRNGTAPPHHRNAAPPRAPRHRERPATASGVAPSRVPLGSGSLTMRDMAVPTRRVLLAKPRGYCAGVDRAVQTVEMALERYGAPVYVRKQIVHNKHVVAAL